VVVSLSLGLFSFSFSSQFKLLARPEAKLGRGAFPPHITTFQSINGCEDINVNNQEENKRMRSANLCIYVYAI
jgi:hypothetical protein